VSERTGSPPSAVNATVSGRALEMEDSWLASLGAVRALTVVGVDGRSLLASGGDDGTVRLWDPADHSPLGEPLTGHTSWVSALTVVEVDGRSLLASGGADGTVRLWDPADHSPLGEPLTGHTDWVMSLTVVEVDGRSLLASGGGDGAVVTWRSGEWTTAEYLPDVEARVLSDLMADADRLEFKPLADAITAAMVHPMTEAPVTIAVKGPWGSGKSTVMNFVRNQLDPRAGTVDRQSSASRPRADGGSRHSGSARRSGRPDVPPRRPPTGARTPRMGPNERCCRTRSSASRSGSTRGSTRPASRSGPGSRTR
jgi:hypothetical protein